jgi:hypothetical protein
MQAGIFTIKIKEKGAKSQQKPRSFATLFNPPVQGSQTIF